MRKGRAEARGRPEVSLLRIVRRLETLRGEGAMKVDQVGMG